MLTNMLRRSRLAARLRGAWRHGVDEALKPVRKDMRRLATEIEGLRATLEQTAIRSAEGDQASAQIRSIIEALELTVRMNEDHRQYAARLSEWINGNALQSHVRDIVARAHIDTRPMPHALIENLFPDDFYRLLLDTFPPAVLFGETSAIKQNLKPEAIGPTVSRQLWTFIKTDVTPHILGPELATKFQAFLHAHCQAQFGSTHADRIAQMPLEASAHRLMLRRSGYRLDPHLDPKHVFLTCLVYLARPGDHEEWGTQLYSLKMPSAPSGSFEQTRAYLGRTVYPEQHGIHCELVKHVPFRPNSALVFVNAGGAHGVELPPESETKLERYAYQFYVGQSRSKLQNLTSGRTDAQRTH